jgi:hypothetical protein
MGLLLLIPGLILALNGVTWFEGEDGVAKALIIIGAVLLLIQVLFMAVAGATVKKGFDRFDRF